MGIVFQPQPAQSSSFGSFSSIFCLAVKKLMGQELPRGSTALLVMLMVMGSPLSTNVYLFLLYLMG